MSEDHREYTEDENREITLRLVAITTRVHDGHYSTRNVDVELLVELHQTLFGGIRFHAGKCRAQASGSEYLQFGPNRSVHRDNVSRELSRVFNEALRSIRSCEEQSRPVLAEFPKQEYNAVLNQFLRKQELDPVVDLLLPCCGMG